jgi:hypothetical protein
MQPVIGFEVLVLGLMKMNQDRHEFAQHHTAPAQAFTLTLLERLAVPVG